MRAFAAAAEVVKRKRKETAKVISCESEGDKVIKWVLRGWKEQC